MTDMLTDQGQVLAEHLKQWAIGGGKDGVVVAGWGYTLKCKLNRKFLQYEHQAFGINLGWTDDAEPETARKVARWVFVPQDGGTQLAYGEHIAMGFGKEPSFVRYEERSVGINLGWSKTPVFEWRVLGGPEGEPVHAGKYLVLFNTRASGTGEALIHFDRTAGVNLGWPTSKTWGDQAIDLIVSKLKDEAKKAAYKLLLQGLG